MADQEYELLLHPPGDNRLFRGKDDGHLYLADASDDDPNTTDDGPLRFDYDAHDQIVVTTNSSGSALALVSVFSKRHKREGFSTWVSTDVAIRLGQRYGIRVVTQMVLHEPRNPLRNVTIHGD